jgi:hypothetical protein
LKIMWRLARMAPFSSPPLANPGNGDIREIGNDNGVDELGDYQG